MKKLILVLVLLGGVVGGYFVVTRFVHINIDAFVGETRPVRLGDLTVPITASGNIQPASITEIKSKASGKVDAVPMELGDVVRNGQLLIQLSDVDERRTVERAEAEWKKAKIEYDTQLIILNQRSKKTAVDAAEAKLADAQARERAAASRYRWAVPLTQPSSGNMTREEWDVIDTNYAMAKAAVKAAEADLEETKTAIALGEQAVKQAEELVNSTLAALGDAKQRLAETKIYSPIEGMVLEKKVQVGEVVQGGQMTLMGGSVLAKVADISEIYAVVNVDEADIGLVRTLAGRLVEDPTSAPAPEANMLYGTDTRPASQPVEHATRGQVVTVTVESFPDEKFEGYITRISPQSEILQAVATFKVWIQLSSPNWVKLTRLLNAQAEARFSAKPVHNALLVSYDAIQKNPVGEGYGVYVPELDPNTGRKVPKFIRCNTGADNGLEIEVRTVVVNGEEIPAKSYFKVGDPVYTRLPLKTKQQEDEEDKKNRG